MIDDNYFGERCSCGEMFINRSGLKKYCSERCKNRERTRRYRARLPKTPRKPSYAAPVATLGVHNSCEIQWLGEPGALVNYGIYRAARRIAKRLGYRISFEPHGLGVRVIREA